MALAFFIATREMFWLLEWWGAKFLLEYSVEALLRKKRKKLGTFDVEKS